MPAILTHHLFGRTLLARENNRVFVTRDTRDAFLLGNQGPDPLFYATLSPQILAIKTLGSQMHHQKIDEYLQIWRTMLSNFTIKDYAHETLQAYVYGFLCHFALDRMVHPLVHAYEHALCNAGVKGLNPEDHSFVHGQIEADLDVFLLYQLTGRTIEEYNVPKQVLYSSDMVLSGVDAFYCNAARIYDCQVPRSVFSRSVKDMRKAVHLLYSPGGTKRELLGRLERIVRPHSLLQAMSHRPEAVHDTWFANEKNEPWIHPETGTKSNASFRQLFDAALDVARADMELFRDGAPMEDITRSLTFSGKTQAEDGMR